MFSVPRPTDLRFIPYYPYAFYSLFSSFSSSSSSVSFSSSLPFHESIDQLVSSIHQVWLTDLFPFVSALDCTFLFSIAKHRDPFLLFLLFSSLLSLHYNFLVHIFSKLLKMCRVHYLTTVTLHQLPSSRRTAY